MPVRTRANRTALILFLIVIAAFFTAGILVPSELPEGGKSPLPLFFFMMGGLFLLINAVILAHGMIMNRRRAQMERNWIPAEAEVLKISETGTYINRQPRIMLRLRVRLPGGEESVVEHRQVMPVTALHKFTPGSSVAVKVDPGGSGRVLLM